MGQVQQHLERLDARLKSLDARVGGPEIENIVGADLGRPARVAPMTGESLRGELRGRHRCSIFDVLRREAGFPVVARCPPSRTSRRRCDHDSGATRRSRFVRRPSCSPGDVRSPPRPGRGGCRGGRADVVTREAVCRWAAKPPVLDGKLDDACWQGAAPITRFASYWDENKTPRAGTRAYLVWDDEALYYGGTMTDAELRSYGKHRNDSLWDGDVFEMFFKPSADGPAYYEFQANPRELIFECAMPRRGDFPKDFTLAPILGNKAVVRAGGDARPSRRQGPELDRRGPHPLVGVPAHRRQAEAGRRVAVRDLPVRLRPGGHQADPDELRAADEAQLPPARGLRQAPLRRPAAVPRALERLGRSKIAGRSRLLQRRGRGEPRRGLVPDRSHGASASPTVSQPDVQAPAITRPARPRRLPPRCGRPRCSRPCGLARGTSRRTGPADSSGRWRSAPDR